MFIKKIEINEDLGKEIVKIEFESNGDEVEKMSFVASDEEILLTALMYMINEYCEQLEFPKEKMLKIVELALECCDDEIEDDEEEKFPKLGMFEISGERAEKFMEFLKDIKPGKHSKESEVK